MQGPNEPPRENRYVLVKSIRGLSSFPREPRPQGLIGDLCRLMRTMPEGCKAYIVGQNIRYWKVTISGPPDTPYAGGLYRLEMRIPQDYPSVPPHVIFLTKVYHCNVSESGEISLDILGEAWNLYIHLSQIFVAIRELLAQPNPDTSQDKAMAELYKKDRYEYLLKARECTIRYAQARPGPV